MPVAAADWSGDRRLVLARVTAVERQEGEGVYMPHALTGGPILRGQACSASGGCQWFSLTCHMPREPIGSQPLPPGHSCSMTLFILAAWCSTGAIIVDGVAASELTSLVPQALAGSHVHRGLVSGRLTGCGGLSCALQPRMASSTWGSGSAP